MVSSDDDLVVRLCQLLENICQQTVTEPAERNRTVSTLVVCQLAYHPHLRTGMGEHIDEVDDEHIEVVLFQVSVLLHELVSTCRVVDLVIGEAIVAAVAFNLCFDERCLVEVLPLFFVFIHPQVREHRRYLLGHQTTEDGVACILCGGRQNAHIEVFLYVEHIADFL